MSQGSWNLWKHAHGYTAWALKLSLLALWALWSLHYPLGTQHSFPWMVAPTTNVLFSAFFKNSCDFYPHPFSNMTLTTISYSYSCLIPSKPDLWLYIIFQFLPISSPFWLTSLSFKPYKSSLWFPPHHSLSWNSPQNSESVAHLPSPLWSWWMLHSISTVQSILTIRSTYVSIKSLWQLN